MRKWKFHQSSIRPGGIQFARTTSRDYKIARMSYWKCGCLLALFVASAFGQKLSGRPTVRPTRAYQVSAQILHEGSFQLQRAAPAFTNWLAVTNFNAFPGTNTFSDSIAHPQRFYRLVRFTEPPVVTSQPTGTTNLFNQEVRLEGNATGSWPLRFQWLKDGQAIPGATSNKLVFAGRANLSGNYNLLASNSWGLALTTPVAVKTVNPVASSIAGKKIQYVIKGAQGGFISSGTFETSYNAQGYSTTSSNPFLADSGQWQYGALSETIGRAVWTQGFVYPNGAFVDMTFTNLTAGTYQLQDASQSGRQFGEFKLLN